MSCSRRCLVVAALGRQGSVPQTLERPPAAVRAPWGLLLVHRGGPQKRWGLPWGWCPLAHSLAHSLAWSLVYRGLQGVAHVYSAVLDRSPTVVSMPPHGAGPSELLEQGPSQGVVDSSLGGGTPHEGPGRRQESRGGVLGAIFLLPGLHQGREGDATPAAHAPYLSTGPSASIGPAGGCTVGRILGTGCWGCWGCACRHWGVYVLLPVVHQTGP